MDNCEYLYHTNDRTEFLNNWTSPFEQALQELSPPLHGVIAPSCRGNGCAPFASHFLHRSHVEIFRAHHPPELSGSLVEAWLSSVYGAANARVLDHVQVRSSLRPESRPAQPWQPQNITREGQELLARLLEEGRASIAQSRKPKLVVYSLYGDDARYTDGAYANTRLLSEFYPGWRLRVYYNRSTPAAVLDNLRNHSAELVDMSDDAIVNQMAWRFLPAADPSVGRFVSRDIDSRLAARERAAVREWELSGAPFHVIRDHPSHRRHNVSGGLWGAVGGAVPDMRARIERSALPDAYLKDMDFLNADVWPLMERAGVLQHDSVSCGSVRTRPFPAPRRGAEHVGSVYVGGALRALDVEILADFISNGAIAC